MLKHKRIYQHLLSISCFVAGGRCCGVSGSEPLPGPPPVFPGKAEVATLSLLDHASNRCQSS